MAAVAFAPNTPFDPESFMAFLKAQPDLGTKWTPRYIRIVDALPRTPTNKVIKRPLRETARNTPDPIYENRNGTYKLRRP